MMTFDQPTLARFKEEYAAAVEKDSLGFTFEGRQFYTPYAKYLIEYMEPQL